MGNVISLKEFLDEYGESMAEKVTRELKVIHDPTTEKEEEISDLLKNFIKKPFPSQGEIVKACYKSLISGNKAVYTVCEMGTGKTLMSIATALVLYKLKGIRRVLVICPPHLVPKWIQEIKEAHEMTVKAPAGGSSPAEDVTPASRRPKRTPRSSGISRRRTRP